MLQQETETSGLDPWVIEAICRGEHGDPFAVLGLHHYKGLLWLRAWLPGCREVALVDDLGRSVALQILDERGLFAACLGQQQEPTSYRLKITRHGETSVIDDPYRFKPLLADGDIWLLGEGSHRAAYRVLGAHVLEVDGVAGTRFAIWAPNAKRVSVVGDFNHWDGRCHPMRRRAECGVWELFVPAISYGERYKLEVLDWSGHATQKADPYAFAGELRPATASIVATLPPQLAATPGARNQLDAPISIYEVHLASWRRQGAHGEAWLSYRELAATLIPYAVDLGFTHLELMPIAEFPFDGSWGYQPIGLYAPTARHGSPEDFRFFIEAAHAAGLGVILDWVPGHFPADAHGLGRFDGTHLYEHADPREGFHRDWNTLIYNYGRREVANFLAANALFWIKHYGIDGLRVDAVASMLYRDYSRPAGEWIPNAQGGRENLEAIRFLQTVNHWIGVECPGAVTLAEESTAFPGVSRPPESGGLGFHYKWNMGWMHDTLQYMQRQPIHRRYHHNDLTFGLTYAFTENFVLPLSHDEVVHGKGSLLSRMPGDRWQQFANLRAYYGLMWTHPGKKLLFMGGEFAQTGEWKHDASLDWHSLDDPLHAGVQALIRDLNQLYRRFAPLHALDCKPEGFQWMSWEDADSSVLSYVRHDGRGGMVLVLCHFTPVVRDAYRVGVPAAGTWREILNTDSALYGGGDVGTPAADSEATPWHGQAQSLLLKLAPLATQVFVYEA